MTPTIIEYVHFIYFLQVASIVVTTIALGYIAYILEKINKRLLE